MLEITYEALFYDNVYHDGPKYLMEVFEKKATYDVIYNEESQAYDIIFKDPMDHWQQPQFELTDVITDRDAIPFSGEMKIRMAIADELNKRQAVIDVTKSIDKTFETAEKVGEWADDRE